MKLTVTETSERLGVSRRRVIAMIEAGKLPAEKFANVYAINEADLALVAERKPGRPKKASAEAFLATRESAPVKSANKARKKTKKEEK